MTTTALQECQSYYGEGAIPKGYRLLIFDSPERNRGFFLDGFAASPPGGGWKTPVIDTGNTPTWITAALVDFASAKFIKSAFVYSIQPRIEAKIHHIGVAPLFSQPPPTAHGFAQLELNHPPHNGSGC